VAEVTFQEYRVRKIVNIHRHADAWFWDKYSATPYVGCSSGCEFCYCRGGRYGRIDPDTFDKNIQVKTNAVERLERELSTLDRDVIACGDWQYPAEEHYGLSRKMLEVVLHMNFPLLVIERSPLLIRDLDLLLDINKKTWVGVILSFSNVDPALKRIFEPRSPGLKRRLFTMAKLADAGIRVGTALMPIIPFLGDDDRQLKDAIMATKDNGGTFVIAAGLTMEGTQAERTLEAARHYDPNSEILWRRLYHWQKGQKPTYGPARAYSTRLAQKLRELCLAQNISDRMPRYIPVGPLAVNKQLAEHLHLKAYDLELEQAENYRIWAYRRAAWTVDELAKDISIIYEEFGEAGLKALSGVGNSLAQRISMWLQNNTPPK
jgi:DNA repair photolyase